MPVNSSFIRIVSTMCSKKGFYNSNITTRVLAFSKEEAAMATMTSKKVSIDTTFMRSEKKYILDISTYLSLKRVLDSRLMPDQYGEYNIANIYYDTEDFDLIKTSLEKPLYKEKLRLRSYGTPGPDSTAFMEIKKKFKGIVYKRRHALPYLETVDFLAGYGEAENQVMHELRYAVERYELIPQIYLSYDRTALAGIEDNGLRVTFDSNILFRRSDLDLSKGSWGTRILDPSLVIMEIKVAGAFPLWLSELLSSYDIFPRSFSKYGTCYRDYIMDDIREGEVVISA